MLSSTLSVHFTSALSAIESPPSVSNSTVYPLFSSHTAVSDVVPAGTSAPGSYVFVSSFHPVRRDPSGAVIPSAAGAVKPCPLLTAIFILLLPSKLPGIL